MSEFRGAKSGFVGKFFLWSWIAAIVVVPNFVALYLDNISAAGLLLVCLVLGGLLSRLDIIEEITVGPLTAKLQRRIDEVEDLLAKLQNVAATISEISLSTMIRTGTAGGFGFKESEKFRTRIVNLLREIGVDEEKVKTAQRELVGYLRREYVSMLIGQNLPPFPIPEDRQDEWQKLANAWPLATPSQIRRFLESMGKFSHEAEELLHDYEYFSDTGDHRRPDVFLEIREKSRGVFADSGVLL